jgi:hypothetical protein
MRKKRRQKQEGGRRRKRNSRNKEDHTVMKWEEEKDMIKQKEITLARKSKTSLDTILQSVHQLLDLEDGRFLFNVLSCKQSLRIYRSPKSDSSFSVIIFFLSALHLASKRQRLLLYVNILGSISITCFRSPLTN